MKVWPAPTVDPLVAFHAVRNLARIGMGVVEHVWVGRETARRAYPSASTGVMGSSPDARHAGRRCRTLTAVRSACRSRSVVPPQMP